MYKIDINEDRAFIYAPYIPEFLARIKRIGGACWKADKKAWSIPAAQVDVAREIMRSVYGRDDRPVPEGGLVTVRLTCAKPLEAYNGPVVVLAHILARATGRDSEAYPGENVALLEGKISGGGSIKNWSSCVAAGSVFRLLDVPLTLIEQETLPSGCKIEIMGDDPVQRLKSEKAALERRIKEIDIELEKFCTSP